jgi:hypothetical protein
MQENFARAIAHMVISFESEAARQRSRHVMRALFKS